MVIMKKPRRREFLGRSNEKDLVNLEDLLNIIKCNKKIIASCFKHEAIFIKIN